MVHEYEIRVVKANHVSCMTLPGKAKSNNVVAHSLLQVSGVFIFLHSVQHALFKDADTRNKNMHRQGSTTYATTQSLVDRDAQVIQKRHQRTANPIGLDGSALH